MSRGRKPDEDTLRIIADGLCQVAALPDALGGHACECSHPEMRRLPEGVVHCPACGSEVLPLNVAPLTARGSKTAARKTGYREMEAEDDLQQASQAPREVRVR